MTDYNADLLALIRTIPDFPQPGVQFRDITTLIHDADGFRKSIDRLADAAARHGPTLVAGIEARGFIFGSGLPQCKRNRPQPNKLRPRRPIGRASCRERGCQYV